jgi:hypothetical protein
MKLLADTIEKHNELVRLNTIQYNIDMQERIKQSLIEQNRLKELKEEQNKLAEIEKQERIKQEIENDTNIGYIGYRLHKDSSKICVGYKTELVKEELVNNLKKDNYTVTHLTKYNYTNWLQN